MSGTEFLAYVLRVFKREDKNTEAYEAMSDMIAQIKYDTKLEVVKEEAYVTGITTLGEYRIALPNDFQNLIGNVTIIEPNDNQSGYLTKISKQEFDSKYADRLFSSYSNTYSGKPHDFCIYANQIYLGPVPDDTDYKYQINYSTNDTSAISSSTMSVPFTDSYIERNILRAGVLAELYEGMENYEEAQYWRQKFFDGKEGMVNKDLDNTTNNKTVMYRDI